MDVAPMIAEIPSFAFQLILGAAAGLVAGYAYFAALRWNVDLFERGVTPSAILLLLVRYAALSVLLVALAKLGAPALLSAALGLLAARRVALRRLGGLE
jgi:F1F0 ATPase subunit 2